MKLFDTEGRPFNGSVKDCPKSHFLFVVYDDGDHARVATCHTAEVTTRHWFRTKTEYLLVIDFRGQSVPLKGVRKFGALHSIKMAPDELQSEAFQHYCKLNQLTYLGPCVPAQPT